MKVTKSRKSKHRQLQNEGYPPKVSVEQREYAEACVTRSRIRMVTWKRWKRVRTRFENLKRSGLDEEKTWMWANTRKGYWRTAHSPILTRALSNERFRHAGYFSFMEYYSAK